MCVGKLARTAVSPLSTSTGRAGMTTGIAGIVARMGGKKKASAMIAPPVLEPTAALGNSSNFNKWGY